MTPPRENPLRDGASWFVRVIAPAFTALVMAFLAWEWWPDAVGLSLLSLGTALLNAKQTRDGWRNR